MRSNWLLLFIFVPQVSFASNGVIDIWKNNLAVDNVEQKQMIEAHDKFSELIAIDPYHPVYQFNLGASFLGIEEKAKAMKMYGEILKKSPLPPEIEFASLYNLGVLHGAAKEVDLALNYYQKALALNPESKEVKTNIELLTKGGKGGGKGKKGKNKKDGKKDNKGKNKQPQKFTNKPQKQPNQFDGKNMSKEDVKKILGELKKQEQRIRAKHKRKGGREADREKAW